MKRLFCELDFDPMRSRGANPAAPHVNASRPGISRDDDLSILWIAGYDLVGETVRLGTANLIYWVSIGFSFDGRCR